MCDSCSAPAVVVGVDGSRAAIQAALWAVDEAVGRDIPLRLVYVIDPADPSAADSDRSQFASARTALYCAQRAVEATGEPVKIETETLTGKPLAKLAEESRSAAILCVGSIGTKHACRGSGSVAAALPALAQCPVAVVGVSPSRAVKRRPRSILVEVDNGTALHHAFEEARLRRVPLRAVAAWYPEIPEDIGDGKRLARAHLGRQVARWTRLYPDVTVEPTVVRGSLCRYLAQNAESVEVFVRASRDCGADRPVECPVLTVRASHL
ncbi:universal stress protein [Mycobacterium kyorinense]|uniref:Universal stress protein n=1 Tax=Mycobacterium kyorinense TaxID=487514 RepID=A0A1A2Z7I3_9MYCO|nr:universal stress protein [Mycobacterium kyorinense]